MSHEHKNEVLPNAQAVLNWRGDLNCEKGLRTEGMGAAGAVPSLGQPGSLQDLGSPSSPIQLTQHTFATGNKTPVEWHHDMLLHLSLTQVRHWPCLKVLKCTFVWYK